MVSFKLLVLWLWLTNKQTKHLYNVRYKVYKVTISHQSADLVGSPPLCQHLCISE